MKTQICVAVLSAVLATACATPAPTKLAGTHGQLTVAGIEPSRVLGAIDTARVAKHPDIRNAGDPRQTLDGAPGSSNNAQGIAVEGVEPAAVLAAIDTKKLVGPAPKAKPMQSANASSLPPEVAKAAAKKNYTTKDLAEAQRDAVKNGG